MLEAELLNINEAGNCNLLLTLLLFHNLASFFDVIFLSIDFSLLYKVCNQDIQV